MDRVVSGAGCTYKLWQPSRRASTKTLPISRDSVFPSIRALPLQTPPDEFPFSECLTRRSPNTPLLTWSNSSESTSSLSPPPARCERPLTPTTQLPWGFISRPQGGIGLAPSSDALVAQKVYDTTECDPPHTVSSFTVLPSVLFRTIPRPLPVPLSLVPPEHIQISPVAGGDLDMTLYVVVVFLLLEFRRVVGLNYYMIDAWGRCVE